MVVKGRSPNPRHVARTHRVDLDWLFERIQEDPGIRMKFCPTKEQLADILTKATFTADQWRVLLKLCQLSKPMVHAHGDVGPSKPQSKSTALNFYIGD